MSVNLQSTVRRVNYVRLRSKLLRALYAEELCPSSPCPGSQTASLNGTIRPMHFHDHRVATSENCSQFAELMALTDRGWPQLQGITTLVRTMTFLFHVVASCRIRSSIVGLLVTTNNNKFAQSNCYFLVKLRR